MTKKTLILGREVSVTFNMATEVAFEEATGTAFSDINLATAKHQYALGLAAILSCKENTDLPADFDKSLFYEASHEDFRSLFEATTECMSSFLRIPETMKDEDAEDADENEEDAQKKG